MMAKKAFVRAGMVELHGADGGSRRQMGEGQHSVQVTKAYPKTMRCGQVVNSPEDEAKKCYGYDPSGVWFEKMDCQNCLLWKWRATQ